MDLLENNFSLIKRIYYSEELQMRPRIIIWPVKLSFYQFCDSGALLFTNFLYSPSAGKEVA